jgi:hypothetical protein
LILDRPGGGSRLNRKAVAEPSFNLLVGKGGLKEGRPCLILRSVHPEIGIGLKSKYMENFPTGI